MLERVKSVMKNKNRVEKAKKQFRQDEMGLLRTRAAFKARLSDDLKVVNFLLDDKDVSAVVITVPQNYLSEFSRAIHAEDLAEYSVEQLDGSADRFRVSRKTILF